MKGFAALAANLRATRRTSKKVALVAGYLSALDDEALPVAARFLSGRPFSAREERTLWVIVGDHGEGLVAVGLCPERLGNEAVAGHLHHRGEHPGVVHPPGRHVALHHLPAQRVPAPRRRPTLRLEGHFA